MVRSVTLLLCSVLLISLAGCSFLASQTQQITVTASDPEAKILVNGIVIGKGRVECNLDRGRNHTVMARQGARVKSGTLISKRYSTIGWIDFVSGCVLLVPFFGLLSSGAYHFPTGDLSIPLPNVTVIDGGPLK
jgi:hypothetical protein